MYVLVFPNIIPCCLCPEMQSQRVNFFCVISPPCVSWWSLVYAAVCNPSGGLALVMGYFYCVVKSVRRTHSSPLSVAKGILFPATPLITTLLETQCSGMQLRGGGRLWPEQSVGSKAVQHCLTCCCGLACVAALCKTTASWVWSDVISFSLICAAFNLTGSNILYDNHFREWLDTLQLFIGLRLAHPWGQLSPQATDWWEGTHPCPSACLHFLLLLPEFKREGGTERMK